jgi:hypothetical protein
MTLLLFSGAYGKMIHEKNEANNLDDTVPLLRNEMNFFGVKWDGGSMRPSM